MMNASVTPRFNTNQLPWQTAHPAIIISRTKYLRSYSAGADIRSYRGDTIIDLIDVVAQPLNINTVTLVPWLNDHCAPLELYVNN